MADLYKIDYISTDSLIVKDSKSGRKLLEFDREQDQFCCGILYIGNITLHLITAKDVKTLLAFFKDVKHNQLISPDYESVITCSLVDSKIQELFEKAGFEVLSEFVNDKTGNTVAIYKLDIESGYIEECCDDDYVDDDDSW